MVRGHARCRSRRAGLGRWALTAGVCARAGAVELPPASDSLSPPGPGAAGAAAAAEGADRPVVLPGATQDPRIVTRKLGGRVGRRPSVNPLNPLAEHAATHLMDSDAECAPSSTVSTFAQAIELFLPI